MKRGKGNIRLSIDDPCVEHLLVRSPEQAEDLIALHEALNKLEAIDARQSRLLHLRFFVGMSLGDAAKALAISERTANRLMAAAQDWLRTQMLPLP
jgi:DNA-directed RNA polymerase specialized sigma24 family protein